MRKGYEKSSAVDIGFLSGDGDQSDTVEHELILYQIDSPVHSQRSLSFKVDCCDHL